MISRLLVIHRKLRAAYIRSYNQHLSRQLRSYADYSYTTDYVTRHTANWQTWLADWSGKPNVHFLEIGSYEGRSAVWFLQNILTNPTSTLDCVDLFIGRGAEARFDHNIRLSGRSGQVRKHKGRSEDVLLTLVPAHFDMIYVDGGHRAANVLMDAMLSWRLLKPDGLIIFDDYRWEMDKAPAERPQIAIDLFLEAYADRITVLHRGYQVAVRAKNPGAD